jgi:hypothetical protein
MKKLIGIVVIVCTTSLLFAQEFSTKLYFEDAKGHRDTLTIGFDLSATDTLDVSFGEININALPFDSVFEVRISDAYALINYDSTSQFLTKKQIFKKACSRSGFSTPAILIKCKYYPIKVKWDKGVFNDSCRSYSFITDWHPGGWFDAVFGTEQGPYFMKSQDSAMFSYFTHQHIYTFNHVIVDTLQQLFFCIASPENFTLGISELSQKQLIVYPNPVADKLTVHTPEGEVIEYVTITSMMGVTYKYMNTDTIDLTDLKPGVYMVFTKSDKHNRIYRSTIIKK